MSTPHLHLLESPADVMLASDVCLVCVHTEQQAIEALAGDDGLLAVGSKAMADKVGGGATVLLVRTRLAAVSRSAEYGLKGQSASAVVLPPLPLAP